MRSLIFLPSLLIFLFTLYKTVKDDHVFLRKNIKTEQFFDIGFITFFASWIITRILSPGNNFSLQYAVIAGTAVLYLMGRSRRLPLGRLFDFFTVSLLAAIPSWFIFLSLFTRGIERWANLSYAAFYFLLYIYFRKGVLPRVINRSIREGSLSIFFLIIFPLASLAFPVFNVFLRKANLLSPENIASALLFILGLVLLLKPKR